MRSSWVWLSPYHPTCYHQFNGRKRSVVGQPFARAAELVPRACQFCSFALVELLKANLILLHHILTTFLASWARHPAAHPGHTTVARHPAHPAKHRREKVVEVHLAIHAVAHAGVRIEGRHAEAVILLTRALCGSVSTEQPETA